MKDEMKGVKGVKEVKILRLVYQMSWTIAQQEGRPGLLPRKQ